MMNSDKATYKQRRSKFPSGIFKERDGSLDTDNEDSARIIIEFLEKSETIKDWLQENLLECDAKWTLFVAAALSYRYEILVNPFPSLSSSEIGSLDIDTLMDFIDNTPKLRVLLDKITNNEINLPAHIDAIGIVYWVLSTSKYDLRRLEKREVNSLLKFVKYKSSTIPTDVFEVIQPFQSNILLLNDEVETKTKIGFYGNKLEHFHNVLNNGCVNHEPFVLTTNVDACLDERSPYCAGWGASEVGSVVSCMALCEYVDNPYHMLVMPMTTNDKKSTYETAVIGSNDIVRVRYLFFYRKLGGCLEEACERIRRQETQSLISLVVFCLTLGFVQCISDNGYMFSQIESTKTDMGTVWNYLKGMCSLIDEWFDGFWLY